MKAMPVGLLRGDIDGQNMQRVVLRYKKKTDGRKKSISHIAFKN
jgi:hypothetical protein